jgi:hypothetical protein
MSVTVPSPTTNPAPQLLTLKAYPPVDESPDGPDIWAATGVLMHPSGMTTLQKPGGVGVKTMSLAVSLDTSTSWVVKAHLGDANLLEHERLHSIAAICVARKLIEDIFQLTKPNVATLQAELNRLHAAAKQRVDAISDKYDADTRHGHTPPSRWHGPLASRVGTRVRS